MLNRRNLFAAGAAVAVIATPIAAQAVAPGHAWFIAEAREIIAMTALVNAGAAEAYVDQWEARLNAFIARVEGLPISPDNAPIKALAIAVIQCEEPDEWEACDAADQRLAGQLVRCLTA